MIKSYQSILITLFLFLLLRDAQGKYGTPLPINYPSDTIVSRQPYIIWQDLYHERDSNKNIRYRITMKNENKTFDPVLCYPDIYFKNFLAFQYPINLNDGRYSYHIERLTNNQPVELRHFHYSKYPIAGEFVINHKEINDIDSLPPEYLIQYIFIERHNRYINKYNSIFYGAGGLTTLGVGILFLKVFDFGLVSTVVSAVCFTTTAVGFSASGYYGYQYIQKKSELQKIIEIGKNIFIKGSVTHEKINADVELSF
jgi:hypothetical protein